MLNEQTVTVFTTKIGKQLYKEGRRFLAIDKPPSYVEDFAHIHPYKLKDGELCYQENHKIFDGYSEAITLPAPFTVSDERKEAFYDEGSKTTRIVKVFTVLSDKSLPTINPIDTDQLKALTVEELTALYEISTTMHHKFMRHQQTLQFKVALDNLNKCRQEIRQRLNLKEDNNNATTFTSH